MSEIILASIVATAKNNTIGKDNSMIWHIPDDLKHFKRTTLGKPIIMGRKSYESLGKALPGRPNIIISRRPETLNEIAPTQVFKDMETDTTTTAQATPIHHVKSIEESIELAKSIAKNTGADEIFITGGGEIYRQTLPITQRLYITILDRDYDGDTYFPEINWNEWTIEKEEKHNENKEKNRPAFTFYTLERKS